MSAGSARRVDGLDLLRGIAIALVMLRHAAPSVLPGAGVVGVVMFFALSDYLITGVLGRHRALVVAGAATVLACLATTWWLAEDPDLAYSLPTSWALCFVVGAAVRLHRDRLTVPGWAVPAALAALAVLSVVPLRGHPSTYLAGGPAIAALTGVLILGWQRWSTVTGPLRALVWLGTLSYAAYLWNYPLSLWLPAVPALMLTLVAAALSWRWVEEPLQRRARRPVAVAA